ncbi:MAG: nicotinamide riboside transporter PnuC [Bacteroidota bacterium]
MSFTELYQSFYSGLLQTGPLEFIAVIAGIISVWFSRKESIWVYPTGLVNTILYVYLSIKSHLLGEASVNFYYTIMSIYGWWLWSRKDTSSGAPVLQITGNTRRDWLQQCLFFAIAYGILLAALLWAKKAFAPEAIPFADAFASATAYTGMWCMARKKVASWYFWIATNLTSIPLYFVKGFMFTSVQFMVLLILAVAGLITWQQKARAANTRATSL